MPAFDSDEDGDAARDWDRQRFLRLLGSRLPADATAPIDAFPHMTAGERAEVLELWDRLGNPFEDPETTRARQKVLADYALMEIKLRELVDDPGPRISDDGEILRGPDGKPLPDENVRGQCRELLARVEHDRAVVLGEAEDDEDG